LGTTNFMVRQRCHRRENKAMDMNKENKMSPLLQ